MDARALRAAVQGVVNELDPEGLLRMGAPLDEYDSEINDFVTAITDDIPITEGHVRHIWDRWFGPARRDRPRLSDLSVRLASIQRVWRGES